ncbi:unnamed protein product [Ascophyllum nodosum]
MDAAAELGRNPVGPNCIFRHNKLACSTVEICKRWASGYVCDGRCNLRHPSGAELAAMKASHGARPRGAEKSASSGSICSPVEGGKGESSSSATSSAPVCKFFVKSRCTKGSSCIFSHATPHQKEQPAWDKSATATVAPRPERKVAALTLRAAAAKARAADTSETSVAASSDAKIGVDEHDGASSETGTVRTDVKDKAVEILERHSLSKRSRVEADKPKTSDTPPKRQRPLEGSVAVSSAGRGAAGVYPESVDLPGRTKRERSPERGPPGDDEAQSS